MEKWQKLALSEDTKVPAVRAYREQHGSSLRMAVDTVNAFLGGITPAKQMGLQEGDEVTILNSINGTKAGQVATLYRDDGSPSPLFKTYPCTYANASGESGCYLELSNVRKVHPSDPLTLRDSVVQLTAEIDAIAATYAAKLAERDAVVAQLAAMNLQVIGSNG